MLLRPVLMPILRNPLQGIADGIRNMLAELLGSSQFFAPLTHSLVLTRGTGSPTFTRATTATFDDWEGVLRTVPAGCARFQNGRMVRNLFTNTGWSGAVSGTYGTPPTGWTAGVGTGTLTVSDSADYSGHKQIQFSGTAQRPFIYQTVSVAANSVYIESVRLIENQADYSAVNNLITGVSLPAGATQEYLINGVVVAASTVPEAGDVISYRLRTAGTAGTPNIRVGLGCQIGSTGSTTFVAPQWEDVTGQADQTASEYVSVGVESAPAYHGSMVDGVKCFPTDLSGNPLPTQYTYDAVSLTGVAGTYVSTPDSVAASITGDIDVRVKAALTDWTPSAETVLIGKWDGAAQRSYMLTIQTNGRPKLYGSTDGTNSWATIPASSAAVAFSDGTTGWVRVTRNATTGATNFYTSADGSTWSPLGTADVTSTSGAIFNASSIVELGSFATGTLFNLSGKIFQAQIYNGINGTLAVDFDASRYEGGTTLTGSTGETWTLQGNAVIHPTNNPTLGYLAEGARTNLCLQSQDITTTWANIRSTDSANTHVAPDGTTTADSLFEDASAATTRAITQAITFTAATHTFSVWLKGINRTWVKLEIFDGTTIRGAYFQLAAGGTVGTLGAGSTATITPYLNGWYRCTVTGATAAAAGGVYIFPAEADNDTVYDGNTSNGLVIWGAQVELGSFASSYIATTTAAVTREADVDSIPTAGNILAAASTVYLEFTPDHTPSGTIALWGTYVDASNYTAILHDATNMIMRKRIAGVNYDATIANAFTANTTYKVCGSWGASSVTVTLDGTEGTPHANTTAAQIAATMQWGADGNSLQQPFATERNARVWQRQLSTSERGAITA